MNTRKLIAAAAVMSLPVAAGAAPVVSLRGLSTRFGTNWVHKGLDLDVAAGEVVSLVGGSGSGKTTLLRQIVGLLQPTEGTVALFGEPLFATNLMALGPDDDHGQSTHG